MNREEFGEVIKNHYEDSIKRFIMEDGDDLSKKDFESIKSSVEEFMMGTISEYIDEVNETIQYES